MPGPHQVWVIDTSSLIGVRETFGQSGERTVFSGLSRLASKGYLLFPPEVFDELERGSGANPDPPLRWAQNHRGQAERKAALETVKEALAAVPDVLDPDKSDEQADPYVLALAVELQTQGYEVTIVTDDRRDKPSKLSLATAAGMLRLPSVPLHALVRTEGLGP